MQRNIISTSVLLILDILWVLLFMGKKYTKQVKDIQGTNMRGRLGFAFLAYILMVVGLNMFVLPNIRKGHELVDSLKYGAVFGLVVYGIYDCTAAAVFTDWDVGLAALDIAWGAFVFFVSAYVGSKLS
jgi:uncharacterized membrane protein